MLNLPTWRSSRGCFHGSTSCRRDSTMASCQYDESCPDQLGLWQIAAPNHTTAPIPSGIEFSQVFLWYWNEDYDESIFFPTWSTPIPSKLYNLIPCRQCSMLCYMLIKWMNNYIFLLLTWVKDLKLQQETE